MILKAEKILSDNVFFHLNLLLQCNRGIHESLIFFFFYLKSRKIYGMSMIIDTLYVYLQKAKKCWDVLTLNAPITTKVVCFLVC